MIIKKLNMHIVILFGVLVLFCLSMTIFSENFLTVSNINNILKQQAMTGVAAIGATLIMITGAMDLSGGSNVAVTGVVFALLAREGVPIILCVLLCLLFGCVVGSINAFLIVKLKLHPTISTLAMQYVLRGCAYIFSGGQAVADNLPSNFLLIARGTFLGVPIPVIILVALFVVSSFVMTKSVFGKYVYAIGGNIEAAKMSGINVDLMRFILFMIMGIMTSLAGVITAGRLGTGNPQTGIGFEFEVIVAVLLGGVSAKGGEGSMIGTFIGVLILGVMNNGLNLLNVNSYAQYVCKGVIMVAAVLIDIAIQKRRYAVSIRAVKKESANEAEIG